jgi:hypothetical protein
MSTKTRDLFILNENYPLESDMYNKYSSKLSQCNKDDKCISWVKYDIEGELKGYAKRVGIKLEESNFAGEQRTVSTERPSRVALYVALAILAVLIIFSINKKNWLLLGGASALGLILYKKPEILPTITI